MPKNFNESDEKSEKNKKRKRSAVVQGLCCCCTTTKYAFKCCCCLFEWKCCIILLIGLIVLGIFCVNNKKELTRMKRVWDDWGGEEEEANGIETLFGK